MFTGLIEQQGEIVIVNAQGAVRFRCQLEGLCLGESIAVDGVCLTVTQVEPDGFWVDVSPETRAVTHCAHWQPGRWVHIERALLVGSRLGGHFVTGHVDACVMVSALSRQGDCLQGDFVGVQPQHRLWLVDKGSVALDGVSLTVNQITADGFSVTWIPHTLEKTHFSQLCIGDRVNIEYDYLAKCVSNGDSVRGVDE